MTNHQNNNTTPPTGPHADAQHRDPQRWLPRLNRVLDQQTDLYRQLNELGQAQSNHIEQGDTDALLTTLARRQSLINQIARLNTDVEPFAKDWPTLLSKLPTEQRDDLKARIDTLDTLVADIAQRDESDRASLERKRNQISSDLRSVSNQRSAVNAYAGQAANANPAPRYQNRQG
jgi:chaperonin cofactor prefoldin